MRTIFSILAFVLSIQSAISADYTVSTTAEVYASLKKMKAGDNMYLTDGTYKDIQLIVHCSGIANKRILISAKNPGKVFFTGDVRIALRGSYITLRGISFKDGSRNTSEWKSHGPGLVAMYGSFNRITLCAFNNFDEAHSAWITTSLDEKGNVPTHCRIDHCSFTNKLTFDQVINLNNTFKKGTIGGPAMYHRIDHCFFSNPRKPGNAGGGIRIGYYRNDIGRCLVDSNVFMRQDSEPEIITGKSQENIYYANTFLNCQGTLNFRHGDHQIAINNFFISTDSLYGYGGMFVWGSNHIIANNYFSLQKTIASRGNAAIYFNAGTKASEHALAYDSYILNNIFYNANGYALHLNPMIENRKLFAQQENKPLEFPHDLKFLNNIFYNTQYPSYTFIKDDYPELNRNLLWKNNYYTGTALGITPVDGLTKTTMQTVQINKDWLLPVVNEKRIEFDFEDIKNIPGLEFDIQSKIKSGFTGTPLFMEDLIPQWMIANMGNYHKKGKLAPELKERLKRITE